jgi:hypothetical protein
VLVILALACGARDRDTGPDLAGRDPAESARLVREMATGCAGLSRALRAIDRSRISGPQLADLVEEAVAASACVEARGDGIAFRLARAHLLAERPAAALEELPAGSSEPAVRRHRAELLGALRRPAEALAEFEGLSGPMAPSREEELALRVAALAGAGRYPEAAELVAGAPLPERPALAVHAATALPARSLEALAGAAGDEPELLTAAADRIESRSGPAAALPWRERAAAVQPGRAELWDALGRSRTAAGQIDQAVAAWQRASDAAPAQPSYRLAPIRALAAAGAMSRARERARREIAWARGAGTAEALVTGSAAASAGGEPALAVALAREAEAARPGDGRLAFLIANRLAEAGEATAAARAYQELLVCGARGRPWHRHEVAGRMLQLAGEPAGRAAVRASLDRAPSCPPVAPEDLAGFIRGIRRALATGAGDPRHH